MHQIQNSWITKDKLPKVKPKAKKESEHVPTITKSNLQRTLRGVRK